jgi:dTDP-4-amino-4,6-dideoxygalactose transaminase
MDASGSSYGKHEVVSKARQPEYSAVRPPNGRTRSAVPFMDLSYAHDGAFRLEYLAAVEALIRSGSFINGPAVRQFENAFAQYVGADFCIGVASGLDALRLALLAYGLEPGDQVIVPAHTFVATLEAVTQAGGIPVPVDIHHTDYTVDIRALQATISPRTRFVVPVHLYGQLADMRALTRLCAPTDIIVLEDACQAHGADRDGVRAGVGGHAAAFSFYPGKNLGALGDAGALVTTDATVAARVNALREHGQREKYRHDEPGYTSRLDTIQAIALLLKLPRLEAWNEQRRVIAASYAELLDGVGDLVLPGVPIGSNPVWHLFVIRTQHRRELHEFLLEHEIGVSRHYPQAVHLTKAYAGLGYRAGAFPIAEALAEQGLSLPMFPGMTAADVEKVAGCIRRYFDGK